MVRWKTSTSLLAGLAALAVPVAASGLFREGPPPPPAVSIVVDAPARILAGATASLDATVTVAPGATAHNAVVRVVLPAGLAYVPGTASAPPIALPDRPLPGSTTLLWTELGELAEGTSAGVELGVAADALALPVGASALVQAAVFAGAGADDLPAVDAATGTVHATVSADVEHPVPTAALDVDLASLGGEVLTRGLDTAATFEVAVTANPHAAVTGLRIDQYLEAGIELLGCGGIDNSPDGLTERPGAPRLDALGALGPGCDAPTGAVTVTNPSGLPPGVYTHAWWDASTVPALTEVPPGARVALRFLVGVAWRENTATRADGAPFDGAAVANLANNLGPATGSPDGDPRRFVLETVVGGTYGGPTVSGQPPQPVLERDRLVVVTHDPPQPPTTAAPVEPPTTAAPVEPPTTAAPVEPPTTATPVEPPTTATPVEPPTTAPAPPSASAVPPTLAQARRAVGGLRTVGPALVAPPAEPPATFVAQQLPAQGVTTTLASADLSVSKRLDGAIVAGANVRYVITVRNAGPGTASSLTLVDALPDRYVPVGATGTGWSCQPEDTLLTCNLASMAAGASSQVTLTVRPIEEVFNGEEIINRVTVTSRSPDPSRTNNDAEAAGIVGDTSTTTTSTVPAGTTTSTTRPASTTSSTTFAGTTTTTVAPTTTTQPPVTGTDASGPTTLGAVLVSAGLALVVLARRPRQRPLRQRSFRSDPQG